MRAPRTRRGLLGAGAALVALLAATPGQLQAGQQQAGHRLERPAGQQPAGQWPERVAWANFGMPKRLPRGVQGLLERLQIVWDGPFGM
jgi:hypothetical protein